MPDYNLTIRAGNEWRQVARFDAADHAHAYLAAAGLIPSEHRGKPFAFAPVPPAPHLHSLASPVQADPLPEQAPSYS